MARKDQAKIDENEEMIKLRNRLEEMRREEDMLKEMKLKEEILKKKIEEDILKEKRQEEMEMKKLEDEKRNEMEKKMEELKIKKLENELSQSTTNFLSEKKKESNNFFKEDEEDELDEDFHKEINNYKVEVNLNDELKMIKSKTISVMLVGRTRTGKSTSTGIIKNPLFQPKEQSIFSKTKEAALSCLA
jgi:signal recognition particle GTPase